MIKRHYFYIVESEGKYPHFHCGIITTISWFANPSKAYDRVLHDFCEKTKIIQSQTKLVEFSRL